MFNNIYKNKKVLVTGHTGFKGSWLSTWLLNLGANVAGFSDKIPTIPSHFEELSIINDIKNYEGDIRNFEEINFAIQDFKPEIIFHLAAQPLVRESYLNPKETFEINMNGTLNVLESIKINRDNIKVGVIITSDKAYDNVEWIYGYRENDKLGGDDPYSGSKGAAELICKSYINSYFSNGFPKISTTRAGNVIGGGDWAKDRIIPDIVRSWSKNEPVIIRNPNSTRPWQHVLEPLSGYLCLASEMYKNPDKNFESFNFGPDSDVNKNVGELIDEMKLNWVNSPGYVLEKSFDNKKEANLLKLCCDKANINLNWYPTLNFNETVYFTIQWYLNYYLVKQNTRDFTINQIKSYTQKAQKKGIEWSLNK